MTGLEIILDKYKEDKFNKEETIQLIEDLYKSHSWIYTPNVINHPYGWDDIMYEVTCTQ